MQSANKPATNTQPNPGAQAEQWPESQEFPVQAQAGQLKELSEICVEMDACSTLPKYGENGTDM